MVMFEERRPVFPLSRAVPSGWAPQIAWILIGAAILLGIVVSAAGGVLLLMALLSVGFLVAVTFPLAATVLSVSWILIIRPNTKLLQTSFGGFTISEVDLLILFSLLCCCLIPRRVSVEKSKTRMVDWLPLLAWPIWMLVRSLLPHVGNVLFASPLVDLRILSSYIVLVPVGVLISRRGGDALLKVICNAAYAVCIIAIGAWALAQAGLLAPGSYALVNVASGAAQDVRPGGEALIPVLALLLVFNRAPLFIGSKWTSYGLLIGEILVSQTLSIVIATGIGVAVALMLNWRQASFVKKLSIVVLLASSAFFALAGTGASGSGNADVNSRFNLSERLGQSSAQYRVSEATTIAAIFDNDPMVLAIGTGPGSLVSFSDGLVHEVKDLTHNVYNNVALKSGLVGVILFFGGMFMAVRRNIFSSDVLGRCLVGAVASVATLSATVPFASTVSGLTAVLTVLSLSVWLTSKARSGSQEGALTD